MLIHGTYQQMHGNRICVEAAERGSFLSNQQGYVFCLYERALRSHFEIMEELLIFQQTAELNKTRDATNYATSNLQESMRRDKKVSELCFRKCIYFSVEMIRQIEQCIALFQRILSNEPTSGELCKEIYLGIDNALHIEQSLSIHSRIAKLSAVVSCDWNMANQQFFATSLALDLSPTLKAADQARLLVSSADTTVKALLNIDIKENQEEIARKLNLSCDSLETFKRSFTKDMRKVYIRFELEKNALPLSCVETIAIDYLGEEENHEFRIVSCL